jgi:N-methylhydantoinase B/oxoprolinase/acetone carboxylase alpha subunit
MLDPAPPAAVAGGNVETSQCIVDVLLGALGLEAGSQGTMNNVSFGDNRRQYYETICGGTGAGPDFDGSSAVHSHMTNSRITDVEVLENRMPVRIDEFSVRPESGGTGRRCGGNGVIRKLRFLEKATLSILSNRRTTCPQGLHGGSHGMQGINLLRKSDGTDVELGATATIEVEPDDVLVIRTPGGGGFGKP